MTVIATGIKLQSPWLPKPFDTTFASKPPLRESHYNFMQKQYKRFIASH